MNELNSWGYKCACTHTLPHTRTHVQAANGLGLLPGQHDSGEGQKKHSFTIQDYPNVQCVFLTDLLYACVFLYLSADIYVTILSLLLLLCVCVRIRLWPTHPNVPPDPSHPLAPKVITHCHPIPPPLSVSSLSGLRHIRDIHSHTDVRCSLG